MNAIYNELYTSTQTIVYACVALICVLVPLQLPFIYMINSIIREQATLFLRIPTKECIAQQERANLFLAKLKVSHTLNYRKTASYDDDINSVRSNEDLMDRRSGGSTAIVSEHST